MQRMGLAIGRDRLLDDLAEIADRGEQEDAGHKVEKAPRPGEPARRRQGNVRHDRSYQPMLGKRFARMSAAMTKAMSTAQASIERERPRGREADGSWFIRRSLLRLCCGAGRGDRSPPRDHASR